MHQGSGTGVFASRTAASASYPRGYRYSKVAQVARYGFAALLALGAGWMAYLGGRESDPGLSTVWLWSALGLVLFAGLLAFSCAVSHMTLTAGSINVRGLFRSRELLREAISGRRVLTARGKPIQLLVPWKGRQFRLDSGYPRDAVLNAWIATLPDLDKLERAASEAKLAADRSYGDSPKKRLGRLVFFPPVVKLANGATLIIFAWACIYPRPYPLVIVVLALMPWCAVALARGSKGLIRFVTSRNDVRPNMLSLLLMPGAALAIRALFDIHLLDVTQVLAFGFIAGLPLVAAVLLAHQRDDTPRTWALPIVLLIFVAVPYGAGVLSLADVLLDHAAPQVFSAEVTGKYISGGRHPQATLNLSPWGPQTRANEITVTGDYYAETAVHSTVCPALYPGKVGLPWFRLEDCAPVITPRR